jgi:hypothetical protein
MEPINYQAQLDDPLKSFAGGFQVARGMEQAKREDAAYEEEQRMKPILEQQARERQQKIMSVWSNPASTREDFKAVMPLMDTKQLDAWGKAFASKDDAVKRDELGFGITVGNALDSGDYGLASKMIKNRVDGLKQSGGNPQEIFTLEQALTDPHRAKLIIHAGTAAREGFMASAQGLGSLNAIKESEEKRPGEIEKTEVGNRKLRADIEREAKEYNLKADEFELKVQERLDKLGESRNPKLTAEQSKIITQGEIEAQGKLANAEQMFALADRVKDLGNKGGVRTQLVDGILRAGGWEGDPQALRMEIDRAINSGILEEAKKMSGVLSDKDVMFLSKPFPKSSSDPEFIEGWLRSYGKLQKAASAAQQSQMAWLNRTGALSNSANQDMQIFDVTVPKGTQYKDFRTAYVRQMMGSNGPEQGSPPAPEGETAGKVDWRSGYRNRPQ